MTVPTVLTAAITAGATITSLQTTATLTPITAGDIIAVVAGFTSQVFVATGNIAGVTSIGIQTALSIATFPLGSFVVDTTTAVPEVTPSTASVDTMTLYNFLPPFLQEQDQGNNYMFLSWLEGIGSQQQIVDNLVRDTPQNVGWSIVLDVNRCPIYALPWLAQFVGLRFSGSILQNAAAMRGAISNPGNWTRGSLASILQASTGLAYTIVERYPDPYSFTVLIQDTFETLTYGQLNSMFATYGAIPAAYPTYGDFGIGAGTGAVEDAIEAVTPGGLVPHFIIIT